MAQRRDVIVPWHTRLLCELPALALIAPLAVYGYNNSPYEDYPYHVDDTDVQPLNYMKVCEPGDVGESKASYVVLGIIFPISRQAVAPAYDDDLVIPSAIDGLPVRKIRSIYYRGPSA